MADAVRLPTWLHTWDCEQACRDRTEASDAIALLLLNSRQIKETYFGWVWKPMLKLHHLIHNLEECISTVSCLVLQTTVPEGIAMLN